MSDHTPDDLATHFRVGREYVMQQCRKGAWPHYRIGRNYFFTDEHVAQIKAANTRTPSEPADDGWGVKKRGAA